MERDVWKVWRVLDSGLGDEEYDVSIVSDRVLAVDVDVWMRVLDSGLVYEGDGGSVV